MTIQTVILAAGQGKRMQSSLPKILHLLAGKPLIKHVLDTARIVSPERSPILIYGHQAERVKAALSNESIQWVEQPTPLGTGHAVLQALPHLATHERVMILSGDVPLISQDTLRRLIAITPEDGIGLITHFEENPKGYGRIIRNEADHIIAIREEKDATLAEKQIHEINTGIYLFPQSFLATHLPHLKADNAQKEYYLTELISLAIKEHLMIHSIQPDHAFEVQGVNDRVQLAALERHYQYHLAEALMRDGVTLLDPHRLEQRGEISIEPDVIIDINVILEGKVQIGTGSHIGAHCILKDVHIGKNVTIHPYTHIEAATIEDHASIGPFARIRPETTIAAHAHIGNFVEIKKSTVGMYSKINHLSYIGDATIGQRVNVGAGTITCNYDGAHKHQTIIQDDVFIGSNTALVAPIIIEMKATIGAGSTLTQTAPANQLTLARSHQVSIAHWKRPIKEQPPTS